MYTRHQSIFRRIRKSIMIIMIYTSMCWLFAFSVCLTILTMYIHTYMHIQLSKPVGAAEIEARSSLPMTALTPGQSQNYWAYGGVALCLLELVICNYYGMYISHACMHKGAS